MSDAIVSIFVEIAARCRRNAERHIANGDMEAARFALNDAKAAEQLAGIKPQLRLITTETPQ